MSSEAGSYLAPVSVTTAQTLVRGSRFVAILAPATDETEAGGALDALRDEHRGASHVCWA